MSFVKYIVLVFLDTTIKDMCFNYPFVLLCYFHQVITGRGTDFVRNVWGIELNPVGEDYSSVLKFLS